MDRRTKARIAVQLTCSVDAGKAEATPLHALTENVSRSGMLMRWGAGSPLPRVEKKLTLDVLLPENSEFGPRVMRCRAQVIRVMETTRGDHEVALRVLSMRFIKPGDQERGKRPRKARDLASMPVATNRLI